MVSKEVEEVSVKDVDPYLVDILEFLLVYRQTHRENYEYWAIEVAFQ